MELAVPGAMSLTRTVPAAVPSLFHSSMPVVGSKAMKKSVPFTLVRTDGEEPVGAGVDVLDQDGAGGRPVALPQLDAVGPVVGREEAGAAHRRQVGGVRAGGAGVDVLDHARAGGRAVALEQLVAAAEVERLVERACR